MIGNIGGTALLRESNIGPKSARGLELARVIDQIDDLCETYGVGTRIPAYRDLMTRFNTSERTILRALSELQRTGRIVRRAGSGTYVADTDRSQTPHPFPELDAGAPPAPVKVAPSLSIIVVASHDNSFLTRGIELVYDRAIAMNLPVSYEPPRDARIDELCALEDGIHRHFLVIGSNRFGLCERIHGAGRKVAFIGSALGEAEIRFPCVQENSFWGGLLATRHLIELGHRKIGLLEPVSSPRYWGHKQAILDASNDGRVVHSSAIPVSQWTEWTKKPADAMAYFEAPDHPTGLCAWNDHDCIGVMTFVRQLRDMRIPEDFNMRLRPVLP